MLQLCQTISAHPNKGTDLCWDHYRKHRTQHAALCPDVLMPSYIQSQGVKSTALDHFQQFESKAPSFHYWAGRRMLLPPGGARPMPGVSSGRLRGGAGCHTTRCCTEDVHGPTPC